MSERPIGYKILEFGEVLHPIEKVGSEGRFQIWHVNHPMAKFGGLQDSAFISVFDSKDKVWVGYIDLRHQTDLELRSACKRSLRKLALRHPSLSSDRVTWVKQSMVFPRYRRLGLGTTLYMAAVAVSARRGEAIVAGACVGDTTLAAAKRVWRSRKFQEFADVEGLVATMPSTI